jgi:hypothetical protein
MSWRTTSLPLSRRRNAMFAQLTARQAVNLTQSQREGIACIVCGDEERPMRPVGTVDNGQVFACAPCLDTQAPAKPGVVLVVGNAETEADRADLTSFGSDVADRLRMPAEIAIGREYNVTDYEAVVLCDSWTYSINSVVLGIEAQEADMACLTAADLLGYDIDTMCGHCFEYDAEAAPVLVGRTWTTSICPSCVATAASVALHGLSTVAA